MDSITQAALGAAVGEALLGKKLGNRALAWGALFGTLPDLDVLTAPLLDTAGELAVHRGLSHSLLLMVVASFALAPWLAKRWKKDKITRARAGWFVFLAWSTHVLIDCFTVYGTDVFYPFPMKRVAFNNLFIIDLGYTLPLLVALVWLAFRKKTDPKRRKIGAWGLGLSTGYVALSFCAKALVSYGFDADLARRGTKFERRMEAPTPFNILLWRSVVDRGDEFWIGYRSIFELPSTPVKWTVVERHKEAFAPMADAREGKILRRFSDDWWIARPTANGVWIADLRFGEMREWNTKKHSVDARPTFSWVFTPETERDRLQMLKPETRDVKTLLMKMAGRIVGQREAWEGNPRLAGVAGSLPEPLTTIE